MNFNSWRPCLARTYFPIFIDISMNSPFLFNFLVRLSSRVREMMPQKPIQWLNKINKWVPSSSLSLSFVRSFDMLLNASIYDHRNPSKTHDFLGYVWCFWVAFVSDSLSITTRRDWLYYTYFSFMLNISIRWYSKWNDYHDNDFINVMISPRI